MIEVPAQVMRVDGDTAWVATRAPNSCGACGGKGCGSSIFARLFHRREPEYPVANPIDASTGDAVIVGIPDGALARATFSGYLVPLALFILGAIAGARLGDAGAVAGAVVGLALAFLWLRRSTPGARPEILRLGSSSCESRN
jgi:sigma-E factor negative regulatory protein RseC